MVPGGVRFRERGSGPSDEELGSEKGQETPRNPGDDLRRALYKEQQLRKE